MNLLFTSVGRRAYLLRYFRKAMGEHGKIYAVNSAPMSTGMAQADESFVSPVIYDKEYIPFLIKLCKEKAIDMLIPLFDRSDLVAPAHKRPLFFVWFWVLVVDLIVLSIYGKLPTGGINDWIGFYSSLLFLFLFIIALPVITILERKRG